MKNMHGIIDPLTLGFIISLFGGITGYIVHPPGGPKADAPNINVKLTEAADTVAINEPESVIRKQ